MTTNPFAFHGLPLSAFPFQIEYIVDGDVVHTSIVDGPGVLGVPGLAAMYGGRDIRVRVAFADGSVVESGRAT